MRKIQHLRPKVVLVPHRANAVPLRFDPTTEGSQFSSYWRANPMTLSQRREPLGGEPRSSGLPFSDAGQDQLQPLEQAEPQTTNFPLGPSSCEWSPVGGSPVCRWAPPRKEKSQRTLRVDAPRSHPPGTVASGGGHGGPLPRLCECAPYVRRRTVSRSVKDAVKRTRRDLLTQFRASY